MAIEIGAILEGNVTGITKYGAFVQLPENGVGMVHISEISYQYINEISEHLQIGQTVKVKVISIDDNGRIALSIKKASPPPTRPAARQPRQQNDTAPSERTPKYSKPQTNKAFTSSENSGNQDFEDKLKQFMQASEGKMSDLKHYTDRKVGSRRGRK